MARHVQKTRPQGAHCNDAGDESQLTSQCTPTTPHTRTARALAVCSPALTPAQESNGIFACEACLPACRPANAPCSARSHLAHPLPCVDRTIGERSLTTPRGLLAQLMELTTYCSDCAPIPAPSSARSPLARPLPCVDRIAGCVDSGSQELLPVPHSSLTSPHWT